MTKEDEQSKVKKAEAKSSPWLQPDKDLKTRVIAEKAPDDNTWKADQGLRKEVKKAEAEK